MDVEERPKTERRQESTDVAWNSAAAGQADRRATSVLFVNSRHGINCNEPWSCSGQSADHEQAYCIHLPVGVLPAAPTEVYSTIIDYRCNVCISSSLITYKLDYCNSLLAGVSDIHLRRIQSVQNATA